jgi:hypothetical protein
MVRPARIELATLGLGVPCSIQFELRARTRVFLILCGFARPGPAFDCLEHSRADSGYLTVWGE